MSDAAFAPAGRSLLADAAARLGRNRAALASLIVLSLIALACLAGPLFAPNPYDRVFQDYVRVEPSLAAYPLPAQIGPAAERIAARMRVSIAMSAIEGDVLHLRLESPRAIDPRLIAYFERSDLFGKASVAPEELELPSSMEGSEPLAHQSAEQA